MKIFTAATLLTIWVASTSATSSADRAADASSDRELLTDTPTTLTTSTNDFSRQRARRGSPSALEFVPGGCIGFDQEQINHKAKVVDCQDASEFVYRDDYLMQLQGTPYCLEARNGKILLRNCDNTYEEQKWFFTAAVNKNKRVYRMFNLDTSYFVERVFNKVTLQGKDKSDQDQLLLELDQNFFDAN